MYDFPDRFPPANIVSGFNLIDPYLIGPKLLIVKLTISIQ